MWTVSFQRFEVSGGSIRVLPSLIVSLEPKQVTDLQQETGWFHPRSFFGGLFYSHATSYLLTSLLWVFSLIIMFHHSALPVAYWIRNVAYILRTENLLNKLSRIHKRVGVCVSTCAVYQHVFAREQITSPLNINFLTLWTFPYGVE